MNKIDLENTALQLKALLTVLCAVDSDNAAALAELPLALKPAAELSGMLYEYIVEEVKA